MAANYNEISSKIVDLVGGKDNISYFTHCVTRLRFNLKDEKKVNKEEIDKLKGVLGSQWQNGQLQVIIGQAVGDVYKEICEANGLTVEKAIDENVDEVPAKKGIKGVIDKIFDGVSGSLTPFIPALIGSGMIKVILIFADMLGADATSGTYQLLSFAGDAGFYFLPIIIGAFAAKKFGANQGLGMVIGGMLVYPSFAASSGLNFLGIPVYSNSYSSTIIPIILSCAVMAPIERFFAKHSPEILRSVLEPLCTILVMIPLAYCLLGPIGSFLGQYLSAFVLWLYNTIGFIGVALFAAIMPFVIMTGMHGAFVPYLLQMLTDPTIGYEPIFFPALIISNINQGVAALAVALKTKSAEIKSTGLSTGVTAIVAGVTEPAMYAVNFKYKTPLYGAMIGSAIGGLVAGIFKCAIQAFAGASSIIALPLFASASNPSNLTYMIIATVVGMVATFAATWVLYKEEDR
ncbi:MAG: PTS transporter subunit EIIC [Erysipelotrichaceae bacterium]|nr:PTS transporter subunit EIIC [Erysipelotrichaceae bacterium]